MYFESHVNVEMRDPASVDDLQRVQEIARLSRMKVTVMDGHDHLEDPRRREYVVTGHGQDRHALQERVRHCAWNLRNDGYVVTRYKIEHALVDSRVVDEWGLLDA